MSGGICKYKVSGMKTGTSMCESVGICEGQIIGAGVETLAVQRECESAKSDMYEAKRAGVRSCWRMLGRNNTRLGFSEDPRRPSSGDLLVLQQPESSPTFGFQFNGMSH